MNDTPKLDRRGMVLARRYARALYELADEQQARDAVTQDLQTLWRAMQEQKDFRNFLQNPRVPENQQLKALLAVVEALKLHPLVRNLCGIVARNRRVAALPLIITAFMAERAKALGERVAEVTVAQPMTAEQQAQLERALNPDRAGKVKVSLKVDPEILGGLVVQMGSRRIDQSIRNRLLRLQQHMKGAA